MHSISCNLTCLIGTSVAPRAKKLHPSEKWPARGSPPNPNWTGEAAKGLRSARVRSQHTRSAAHTALPPRIPPPFKDSLARAHTAATADRAHAMHCTMHLVVAQLAAGLYTYPIGREAIGKHSHSQDVEDLALYEQFFSTTRQGRFVEMGALDGSTLSNTYAFETVLNWTGSYGSCKPRP